MKNQTLTESEFAAARDWVRDHGFPSSVNAITDIESPGTIYLNEGERWGDAYWYVESEVAEMIQGCGWDGATVSDVLSDGAEVPTEVVTLASLKPSGMKWHDFANRVESSESLDELQSDL